VTGVISTRLPVRDNALVLRRRNLEGRHKVINLYAHTKIRDTERQLADQRLTVAARVPQPVARVAGTAGRALQRVGTTMEAWATAK
jgi:hypothetical protein